MAGNAEKRKNFALIYFKTVSNNSHKREENILCLSVWILSRVNFYIIQSHTLEVPASWGE